MEPPLSVLQRRRNNQQEPIAINIKSDTALSVSSCAGIVEELIKYILYQRCQIPVPFDALVREVRLQNQAHHRDQADPQPQDQISRKKEITRQKSHRKRQQWLNKVEKFLQNFNFIKESLCNELESGIVKGVKIILGSSVMTGRESYFIRLPESYSSQQSSTQPPRANHTGVKLFRTLVTNEALLKVMNRPCGAQRIWVMVQKSSSPLPDNTTAMEGDTTTANLIPRPEYSQNLRATMVEINIQHTCINASMDLTPTVGSGITLHNLGIKRSLYLTSPSVCPFYSHNIDQDTLHCNYQGKWKSDNGVSDSDRKKMLPPSLSGHSESTYNRPFLETPVKILKGDVVPIVETPVHFSVHKIESFTPSKQLAKQLGTFNLSDDALDSVWYQIDCLISGFKDMCIRP